jgi:hypothetical protein
MSETKTTAAKSSKKTADRAKSVDKGTSEGERPTVSDVIDGSSSVIARGARDLLYIGVGFGVIGAARGAAAGREAVESLADKARTVQMRADSVSSQRSSDLSQYRLDLENVFDDGRETVDRIALRSRDIAGDVIRRTEAGVRDVLSRVGVEEPAA